MSKNKILYIIFDLIFVAVFNLIFFLVGGADHPVSVWLAYGFIHFAYLMVVLTPFFSKRCTFSHSISISTSAISVIYFVIELIIGIIFICVKSESYKASLIVQVVLLAIYGLFIIPAIITNDHTVQNVKRHESEVFYLKDISSRVKMLEDRSENKMVNREIERLYDYLHSSPAKSTDSVKAIEAELYMRVGELENAVRNKNDMETIQICGAMLQLAESRNRLLML